MALILKNQPKPSVSQAGQEKPIRTIPGWQRQDHKFKASLIYAVSFSTAKTSTARSSLKGQTQCSVNYNNTAYCVTGTDPLLLSSKVNLTAVQCPLCADSVVY